MIKMELESIHVVYSEVCALSLVDIRNMLYNIFKLLMRVGFFCFSFFLLSRDFKLPIKSETVT